MIDVVVPTSRVGRSRQAERVVDAQVRCGSGRRLRATWSCLCAAGVATLVFALAACGEAAHLPVTAGAGPSPALRPPQYARIPAVNIAPAKKWPYGTFPQAAPGTRVRAFARDLDHPRWLYVLPNGDVLVAEANAPSRPDDGNGIHGWLPGHAMTQAGAGVPGASRITLLRDADGDGVAEFRSVLIERVNSPFGMALVGDQLYVAAYDAVLRFPYVAGATRIVDLGTKLAETVVNEPGEFSSDLVPDPTASVRDGIYFGWPQSHYGQRVDERVAPPRPDLVASAIAPDHAPDTHTASAGLAPPGGHTLPATYADGTFVGRNGSSSRRPSTGYKVIFVPFENATPSGAAPVDVLTGPSSDDGGAFGRPAGVFLDNQAALLVADDVGNTIWRMTSGR